MTEAGPPGGSRRRSLKKRMKCCTSRDVMLHLRPPRRRQEGLRVSQRVTVFIRAVCPLRAAKPPPLGGIGSMLSQGRGCCPGQAAPDRIGEFTTGKAPGRDPGGVGSNRQGSGRLWDQRLDPCASARGVHRAVPPGTARRDVLTPGPVTRAGTPAAPIGGPQAGQDHDQARQRYQQHCCSRHASIGRTPTTGSEAKRRNAVGMQLCACCLAACTPSLRRLRCSVGDLRPRSDRPVRRSGAGP